MARRVLVLLLVLAAALVGAACDGSTWDARRRGPELLALADVVPAEVHPGDRLDVLGVQLPSGDATSARVVLRGTLRRPGREPVEEATITIDGASIARDRVSTTVTDEILERLVGRGDEALHTTFTGSVEVEIPTPTGMPVYGTVKHEVRLDFVPRVRRHALEAARDDDARRALAWLGVDAQPAAEPGGGGVVIASVRPGGPAASAGLAAGDRIERLDGLTVIDARDLVPRPSARAPILSYRRGSEVVDVAVTTAGFRPGSLRDLVPAIALLGALAIVLGLRAWSFMRFASWAELRLVGQASPRSVRLREARSWVLEAIRSIVRDDDDVPQGGGLATWAPHVVFACVSLTFGALPFAGMMGASDLDVATLLLASQTGLVVVGLATGAWSAERPFSPIRSLRAAARLLSLAIPTFAAAACVVLRSGSVRAAEVLASQAGGGGTWLEAGGWPWTWNAARNPLVFVVFALGLATTLVEPDDGAPLRSSGGRGARAALFFLAEWTHVFVLAALGALLFLGGWLVPGLPADRQAASAGWTALGAALFLVKAWAIVLAVVAARWTFPRIREGVVTRVAWTRLVPAAVAVLGVAVGWERLRPDAAVELVVAAVVLTSSSAVAALVLSRVARALRSPRPRLSLNPFL